MPSNSQGTIDDVTKNVSKAALFVGRHWKLVIGLLFGAILISGLQQCGKDPLAALRKWKAGADSSVVWSKQQDSVAKIDKHRADSLQIIATELEKYLKAQDKIIAVEDKQNKILHDKNVALHDSLEKLGQLDPLQHPENLGLIGLVDQQQIEIKGLRTELVTVKAALDTAKIAVTVEHNSAMFYKAGFDKEKFRADSLQKTIVTMPPLPTKTKGECRYLKFIPCPSRTVTAIVVGATGVYAGIKLGEAIGILGSKK